tara:strand:- start:23 stop:712 length:690 start_codon:yes stop_codon:yes gene_type:complete
VRNKNINYPGWELKYFDKAKNFRKYQFNLIKNNIKGNIAEIGPGNGVFLKYYIKNSKKIYLYEPTVAFNKNLKKNRSKRIRIINKKFRLKKNFFDTILYLDVVEHIENDKIEIKNAFKSLRKGGKLIINVPAFQHLYSQFDKDIDHFRRYSKSDFKKILDKLKIYHHQIIYFDSLGYMLSLLSKIFVKNYRNHFAKKIKFWDTLIPMSKFFDKILFHSFGKSLLVIIEK